MDKTTAYGQFLQQKNASCEYEQSLQSMLVAFQQGSADEPTSVCEQPCPAFVALVEDRLRLEADNEWLRAQNKKLRQMHFGRSSKKGAVVVGGPGEPEASPTAEDSPAAEPNGPPAQESKGPSTQDQDSPGNEHKDETLEPSNDKPSSAATPKTDGKITSIGGRRGAKDGHPGHGRHIPRNLETEEVYLRVADNRRFCPITGEEAKPLPRAFWEKSTQIEIVVKAVRKVYYREKLKFENCGDCPAKDRCSLDLKSDEAGAQTSSEFTTTVDNNDIDPVSVGEPLQSPANGAVTSDQQSTGIAALASTGPKVRFFTADEPPQAVNKSKLDHFFIAFLIYLKYFLAVPLSRISTLMAAFGFRLNPSSMTCTFKHHKDIFEKLYLRMAEEVKKLGHANADETRWMSFFRRDGKVNFMDWMWIIASEKVALYVLDTSRSSKVLFKWLGDEVAGVVTADRAHAYKKYTKEVTGVILSFCWAHFRRDFVRAAVSNALLREWAKHWIGRIFYIYQLNRERLKVLGDAEAFPKAQAKLEHTVNQFFDQIKAELSDPKLYPAQREVLECALRHWAGLTVFVRDPLTPLDNNRAERLLRIVALGRKNFYGTYAQWSGEFTAICLTILQTAVMHDLEPMAYIKYYLDVCGRAGRVPKDLEPHLPWNIPAAVRQQHGMSKKEQDQCA